MKKCENCGIKHLEEYGSGRFCSIRCARGFSTKNKRSEINEKVSKKLTKYGDITLVCKNCSLEFIVNYRKKNQKYCSKLCLNEYQKGKKKNGNYSKNGGFRENGGRTKLIEYENWLGEKMKLNIEEIEVAKILDSLKLKWKRNWTYFKYLDQNYKEKRFYPDFYIKNFDLFVEYKGWLTEKMRHKIKKSKEMNEFNLLVVVGDDKRFQNDGLNINFLKEFLFKCVDSVTVA